VHGTAELAAVLRRMLSVALLFLVEVGQQAERALEQLRPDEPGEARRESSGPSCLPLSRHVE